MRGIPFCNTQNLLKLIVSFMKESIGHSIMTDTCPVKIGTVGLNQTYLIMK